MATKPKSNPLSGYVIIDDGSYPYRSGYRALEPHTCGWCGGEIAKGEIFIRRGEKENTHRTVPVCKQCVPHKRDRGIVYHTGEYA